jgi:hypothetical protein
LPPYARHKIRCTEKEAKLAFPCCLSYLAFYEKIVIDIKAMHYFGLTPPFTDQNFLNQISTVN